MFTIWVIKEGPEAPPPLGINDGLIGNGNVPSSWSGLRLASVDLRLVGRSRVGSSSRIYLAVINSRGVGSGTVDSRHGSLAVSHCGVSRNGRIRSRLDNGLTVDRSVSDATFRAGRGNIGSTRRLTFGLQSFDTSPERDQMVHVGLGFGDTLVELLGSNDR